jgi:hypothetical protein
MRRTYTGVVIFNGPAVCAAEKCEHDTITSIDRRLRCVASEVMRNLLKEIVARSLGAVVLLLAGIGAGLALYFLV